MLVFNVLGWSGFARFDVPKTLTPEERDAIRQMIREELKADSDVDILVANAGLPGAGKLDEFSAEEVKRAVPVAAHERDGQQVEEAAEVALEPVARAAVLARAMVDG